jgi:phosphoglycolate phosphatase
MVAQATFHSKSVCIFDFDGTLVDSMGDLADLAAKLVERHYSISYAQAREHYLRTSGLPFSEQLQVIFPNHSSNPGVAAMFEEKKQERYFSRPYFKEVPQAVERLRESGVRVVISSNNGQKLVETFLEKKARPKFDLVLGFLEGFSKGRDHFQKVLEHFDLDIEAALFVGDSLHDAKKAFEFGIDFVGRVGTFSQKQFQKFDPQLQTVEGLDELIGVLCKSSF